MNIDKVTLGRKARDLGFVRDTLEKVIRLTEILKGFSEDEFLDQHFILKCGTAINLTVFELTRLSVDIDIDFTPNLSKDDTKKMRTLANEKINHLMELQGYTLVVTKSKFTYSLASYVFSYHNAGG